MARTARKESKSGIYHILLRAESFLFLNDDDKEYFMLLIKRYFQGNGNLYGYRITEKKAHLILAERGHTISEMIKPFCTSYARYFNRVHNVEGKFFNDRFKSEPLDDEISLAQTLRFLYRENPMKYKYDEYINIEIIKSLKPEYATTVLCMDDYENMSKQELLELIQYICGDKLTKFESVEEKLHFINEADVSHRLRNGLIRLALDSEDKISVKKKIAKPIIKQEIEQVEEKKPIANKKELSVWLL